MKRLSMFLILLLAVIAVYAGGIGSAKEFVAFAKAINQGGDISAWQDDKGVVCLECDIDMKKAKKLPLIIAFNGVFDGQGFALKNWKAREALTFHSHEIYYFYVVFFKFQIKLYINTLIALFAFYQHLY